MFYFINKTKNDVCCFHLKMREKNCFAKHENRIKNFSNSFCVKFTFGSKTVD